MATLKLNIYTGERPPTINRLMAAGNHWGPKAATKKAWELATAESLLENRRSVRAFNNARQGVEVEIAFLPIYNRGPVPDTDGLVYVYKSIIDGLIGSIIEDDTGEYVKSITQLAPTMDRTQKYPVIRVTIRNQRT